MENGGQDHACIRLDYYLLLNVVSRFSHLLICHLRISV